MFSGKNFLITGANGGIGYAISKLFLENGANLTLFYHKDHKNIDELKKSKYRDKITIFEVDLLDENNLKKSLDLARKNIDFNGFIHSVSLPIENKNFLQMSWFDYNLHIEIQTKSFLQIVQALTPSMKENKEGRILSILTSYIIGRPPNNISNYLVAKYSLLGLSKSLAVELGKFGITVNCISPSMTNTPLIDKLPSKLKEISANNVPIGKLAEPNEIASAALFFCSSSSSYISGENLLVSAGETMH